MINANEVGSKNIHDQQKLEKFKHYQQTILKRPTCRKKIKRKYLFHSETERVKLPYLNQQKRNMSSNILKVLNRSLSKIKTKLRPLKPMFSLNTFTTISPYHEVTSLKKMFMSEIQSPGLA